MSNKINIFEIQFIPRLKKGVLTVEFLKRIGNDDQILKTEDAISTYKASGFIAEKVFLKKIKIGKDWFEVYVKYQYNKCSVVMKLYYDGKYYNIPLHDNVSLNPFIYPMFFRESMWFNEKEIRVYNMTREIFFSVDIATKDVIIGFEPKGNTLNELKKYLLALREGATEEEFMFFANGAPVVNIRHQ